jgi:hypothetical protein
MLIVYPDGRSLMFVLLLKQRVVWEAMKYGFIFYSSRFGSH